MKRLVLVAALVASACGDDSHPNTQDASGDATNDGSTPNASLTAFVIDLVNNQTASNTPAVPFASFSTLPDPDATNNNTAAYGALFP